MKQPEEKLVVEWYREEGETRDGRGVGLGGEGLRVHRDSLILRRSTFCLPQM